MKDSQEKYCTLCGSIRNEQGACTLLGCKDPTYDYRVEQAIANDRVVFEKAVNRSVPVFTLVGSEMTAPIVLCEWIKLNIQTAPAHKLREALEDAILMRQYPRRKIAD